MWRNPKYKKQLFNTLEKYNEIIIYDIESSGLSCINDRIIQLSAIKYKVINKERLEIAEIFNQYIKPDFEISEKIEEITGITNDFLIDKPKEFEVFDNIKKFFGEKYCICGYNNTKFDNEMMKALYERYNEEFKPEISLDVFLMCRDIIHKDETDNFKLSNLVELYGLADGLQFHNALDDVKATGELLNTFIHEYKTNTNLLIKETTGKPIPKIYSISFWKGYNQFLNRVYVSTNMGKIYYNIYYKFWENKDKNVDVINTVDMEKLEEQILKLINIDMVENIHKFKSVGYKKFY